MISEKNLDSKHSKPKREQPVEREEKQRLPECPWCGSRRNRSSADAVYCDAECDQRHANYMRHYEAETNNRRRTR